MQKINLTYNETEDSYFAPEIRNGKVDTRTSVETVCAKVVRRIRKRTDNPAYLVFTISLTPFPRSFCITVKPEGEFGDIHYTWCFCGRKIYRNFFANASEYIASEANGYTYNGPLYVMIRKVGKF